MNTRVYICNPIPINPPDVEKAEDVLAFCRDIYELCEVMSFLPHIPRVSENYGNVPLVLEEPFGGRIDRIHIADLVIANIDPSSRGLVCGDIEAAIEIGIPVIALYKRGTSVKALGLSNLSISYEIQFKDHKDALAQLEPILDLWKQARAPES